MDVNIGVGYFQSILNFRKKFDYFLSQEITAKISAFFGNRYIVEIFSRILWQISGFQ
jgi:hypothetical protein